MIPTLDFETYSEAGYLWNPTTSKWESLPGASKKGLGVVGSTVYSEHPSTEVLTASYDLCDGRGVRRWRPGQPLPLDLFEHIYQPGCVLESHNAMFERLIWQNVCVRRYGWPALPPHVQRCSMATAHVNQYPGALGNLGDVLQLPIQKDKEGTRLINKFCVPRNPTKADPRTRIRPEDDPEDFERLCAYCDQDARAEMAAAEAMPPMTPNETNFWLVDQEINARGIAIDRASVRNCAAVLDQVLARYTQEALEITGGIGPSQVQATMGWLGAQGVHVPSLDSEAVTAALDRPLAFDIEIHQGRMRKAALEAGQVPAPPSAADHLEWLADRCRRVLEIRQLTGSASVKKLYAMELQAGQDDRLHNLIVHHGARTGRPTGEGPQPLNLPRSGPKLLTCACGRPYRAAALRCPWCGLATVAGKGQWKPEMIEPVLEIMAWRSIDAIEHFFGDALLTISGCLRGLFVAAPGHDLIASDYSAIEAVVAAELAGEQWRIDAFHNKEPIYLVGASKITGVPVSEYLAYAETHGDHHPDRQTIGKVSELACLAGDTRVAVLRGDKVMWVPITRVERDDLVYDGRWWVSHEGIIDRGVRPVIHRAGICATPDHLIWSGRRWRTFESLDDWSMLEAVKQSSADHFRMPKKLTDRSEKRKVAPVYDLANCGPRNRFLIASDLGPVLSHNCGFGGWIGSYKAFGSTEDDATIKAQILAWRAASPAIVEMWGGQYRGMPWEADRRSELYGLEGVAIAAIQNPGGAYDYRGIGFKVEVLPGGTPALIVTLPSGRRLTYHEPMLRASARRPDELSISYMTWNTNPNYGPRGWIRMETYGGRLFENVVQAVAHCLLRFAILNLRAAGYPTVLHVYDEIVVEVPEGAGSIEEVERIMALRPAWAATWAVRAEGGWRGRRYRKG